jgi:2-C-methyl-D-erythritol 4-phosphate cytidylyltransferase
MVSATISVIVPAAGCGARAGLNGNKILAPIHGRPILAWTLQALIGAFEASSSPEATLLEVIVAARPEEWGLVREAAAGLHPPPRLVAGGATRQDSVHRAVSAASGDFVLVHDAARPCVSTDVVQRTLAAALRHEAALAALPVSDTVKRASGTEPAMSAETLDRRTIWLAQTPQIFRRILLLEALKSADLASWQGTDCASLVERLGHPVALVEGSSENLKVTFGQDVERASQVLSARF